MCRTSWWLQLQWLQSAGLMPNDITIDSHRLSLQELSTNNTRNVLFDRTAMYYIRRLEVCHRRCAMAGVSFSMLSLG